MPEFSERKLTWAFGFSLIVLAINAYISYRDLAEQAGNASRVVRSREVLDRIRDVESALKDAEMARLGFQLHRNDEDQHAASRAAEQARRDLSELIQITEIRPDRHLQFTRLEPELIRHIGALRRATDQTPEPGSLISPDLPESSEGFRSRLRRLQGDLHAISGAEVGYIEARMEERRRSILRTFVTFSVASTIALLTVAATYISVRRSLRERERTDQSLRASETRMRLLFESVGEGIYGVDTHGRCTFCNPAALQLLGFDSAEQILGREMHQLIHHSRPDGDPFPSNQCPIYQTFRTGKGVLGVDDFFYRSDGRPIPVEYRAHAIRRGDEVLGAVVTFVDIAARRKAETEMRQRDRALQAIAQGVFISDLDRPSEPIIYANAAFERLTGYQGEDWRGKSLVELQSDECLGTSGEFPIVRWDRRELAVEMRARRKDGSSYWQSLTLAPVADPQAKIRHLVGVVTDVSEQRDAEQQVRRSEERLRLMVESVRDYAIFSIDLDGRISSWNSGAERLFGYPEAAIVGKFACELNAKDDREADLGAADLATANISGRSEDERWQIRANGTTFLASGLTTAVHDDSGSLLGYTRVARDITDARRAELELRAAKEAAETAVRAKSAFLANMGHELRTPLNAIIGYSEMLGDEAGDRGLPDFVSDLDRIKQAGYLLLKLINNVLDLSKIETGRIELADEPFDVADLVRSVVRAVEPLAEQRGDTIQVIYASDLGIMHADLAKISQCLNHLLNNAVKFTEAGTILFRVWREVASDGEGLVAFSITDDGIGMTRDQLAGLFDPFTQADGSTTRRYGGSGLGLSITQRYCQAMGGRIEAVSSPGQGTTFTMRFPTSRNRPAR